MKGLLLKDWYMTKAYCKASFLVAAAFIVLSFIDDDNWFFVFYPSLLCGMLPVNLLGYDERSRWMQYSRTMPYTNAQLVSEKYLVGLLAQITLLIIMGIVQLVKGKLAGTFVPEDFAVLMLLMFVVSTITSAIPLPLVFKLGVEKGRMTYYAMIGFACCASALASGFYEGQRGLEAKPALLLAVLFVAGIGIYLFSWYLSVAFYQKREIH